MGFEALVPVHGTNRYQRSHFQTPHPPWMALLLEVREVILFCVLLWSTLVLPLVHASGNHFYFINVFARDFTMKVSWTTRIGSGEVYVCNINKFNSVTMFLMNFTRRYSWVASTGWVGRLVHLASNEFTSITMIYKGIYQDVVDEYIVGARRRIGACI